MLFLAPGVSQRRGWQGSQAVLVGLQELAAGGKSAVKAGREAGNVRGDVGEDTWCGLIVVGDLKKKIRNNSSHYLLHMFCRG